MEIGPIFRALFHHKSRFWLITLEIALTLAIVANCVNMILDHRAKMLRPSGMDEENLLAVTSEPFAPDFEDEEYVQASYAEDLRALRALPGVRAAAGIHHFPLSGSGSATGRRVAGTEGEGLTIPYFRVGPDVLQTLGVELIQGRDFVDGDFQQEDLEYDEGGPPQTRNVILTKEIADQLFPDGGAVGSIIEPKTGTSLDTVVGVVAKMHCSWPLHPFAERVILFPGEPANDRRSRYLVRAEPGSVDGLYTSLETELLRVNDGRIVKVRTLKEIKLNSYGELMAVSKMLGGLSVLLVIVTSIGIIGLTSFSVTQRTREIGTRRALGATRGAILRYFLVENWLITSVGLTLGLLATYGLNFALAHWADVARISWLQVAAGMVTFWLLGLLAALAPALRGTTVPPVVATRTV
jgi:putative ABC transport system permease protein